MRSTDTDLRLWFYEGAFAEERVVGHIVSRDPTQLLTTIRSKLFVNQWILDIAPYNIRIREISLNDTRFIFSTEPIKDTHLKKLWVYPVTFGFGGKELKHYFHSVGVTERDAFSNLQHNLQGLLTAAKFPSDSSIKVGRVALVTKIDQYHVAVNL